MAAASQGMRPRFLAIVLGVAIAFALALLVGQVLSSKYNVIYYYSDVQTVSNFSVTVNGESRAAIFAPTTIKDLKSGDVVVLSTNLEYRIQSNLMFQTQNVPVNVFIDGRLFYFYGERNTYPAFQKQPPPTVVSVTLPETAQASQASGGSLNHSGKLDLRLEYTLLDGQDSLSVPLFLSGDKVLLFQELLGAHAPSLLLGLAMLLGALALIPIGLVIMRRAELATSFVWLGLTCLACAMWTLGSNAVVIYLIPQSSMLYTLSYIGFYLGITPLLCFCTTFLQPRHRWPLIALQLFAASLFIVVTLTHLTSVFSFYQWLFYAEVMEFIFLLLFLLDTIIEMIVFNNRPARLLFTALSMFVLFSAIELINLQAHFFASSGELLQVGLLLFIVSLGFSAWQQVNVTIDAAERSERLEAEVTQINRNLEVQHALYETLTTSSGETRKLRHDMRHQLSAIKGMIEKNELPEAESYIDTLYGAIPNMPNRMLCENFAINALALHYLAITEAKGIQCDLRLVVPKTVGRILDNDLCIIIGNLLENAIEACDYVEEHKRFIKLSTTVDKTRFTLVMDNSFDGHLRVRKGEFYSRKRGSTIRGIGMQSVRAEVLKYGGVMKHETDNEIFKLSLYVKL